MQLPGKKDMMLLAVLVLFSAGMLIWFVGNAARIGEIAPTNVVLFTDAIRNVGAQGNDQPSSSTEDNGQPQKDALNEAQFGDFFRLVFLAKFTGQASSPVSNAFSTQDKIVLSVQILDGLETKDTMYVVVVNDNGKELSRTSIVPILDGEVALTNPGKKGSYEAHLYVGTKLIEAFSFTVQE